jgi:exodeoxyribonuclease V alpha subunit
VQEPRPLVSIKGHVDKLFYYKDGFAIFRVLLDDDTLTTVKGKISREELGQGARFAAKGSWSNHPKFGPTFTMGGGPKKSAGPAVKSDYVVKFLAAIPHMSMARARELNGSRGTKTLVDLWKHPSAVLGGVEGMDGERLQSALGWLEKNRSQLGMLLILDRLNVPGWMEEKIRDIFPDEMFRQVRENPYLLTEVEGVNFKWVDSQVLQSGLVRPDANARLDALVTHCLESVAHRSGHTRVNREELFRTMRRFGGFDAQAMQDSLIRVVSSGAVVEEDRSLCLGYLHEDEVRLAGALTARTELPKLVVPKVVEDPGLRMMLREPVSFLTGGPGTGKTYTIRALSEQLNGNVTLCAPTGKAAKRLAESTGFAATTIHSLLLSGRMADNLVVDEASMLSTELGAELVQLIESKRPERVVFVGDPDQLPSIGPGRVFDDLIDAGRFPVHRLTKIRRQEQDSMIVANAAAIRMGRGLTLDNRSDFRVSYLPPSSQEGALKATFERGLAKLKKQDGTRFDPLEDVQVIAPMHRGPLGCLRLNKLLQDLLNPHTEGDPCWEVRMGENTFSYRDGDKVIFTRNDRERGVVNGDMGRLVSIGLDDVTFEVETAEGRETKAYSKHSGVPVSPGYAITVHKVQGSEFPMVILMFPQDTPPMFRVRNMLYTAVTRAREMCYIIGDQGVVEEAIANDTPDQRRTGLAGMLARGQVSGPDLD